MPQQTESDRRASRTTAGSDSDSSESGDDESGVVEGNGDVVETGKDSRETSGPTISAGTLLDGDFLEFTNGRPLPLTDRAKALFHMSVLNVSFGRVVSC